MKSGVLLFDIDRTIFDTDRMSEAISNKIIALLDDVSRDDFQKAKDKYFGTLKFDREFDPQAYTRSLCYSFDYKNQDSLLDVFYGGQIVYKDYVFPQAIDLFNKLKDSYRLGIFSEGTEKFQNHKFNLMGVGDYLDESLVFVLANKTTKESINKIPKGAGVIDDKERICEYLTKNDIKAIWLNRKSDFENPDFQTVHNFEELSKILI